MKKLISILIIIISLTSCNKKMHDGKWVARKVKNNYVKFDGLRRWYYIPVKVNTGDTLYMMIQNRQLLYK